VEECANLLAVKLSRRAHPLRASRTPRTSDAQSRHRHDTDCDEVADEGVHCARTFSGCCDGGSVSECTSATKRTRSVRLSVTSSSRSPLPAPRLVTPCNSGMPSGSAATVCSVCHPHSLCKVSGALWDYLVGDSLRSPCL
jgi:hypothetical protein